MASRSKARSELAAAFGLLGLLWPLVGCLDVDALRDRAVDDEPDARAKAKPDPMRDAAVPDGCDVLNVRAVRFWKLHVGSSDYVTLKNPTDCPIELGGLNLFFDEHGEVFATEPDCLVQLPAFRLEAGAEVRVHETPMKGDIGALDNKITECSRGFPFKPSRGGVSYLCDGECGPDSVIDMVVHSGDQLGPPELQFGQTFDAPLTGVTVATQDSAHYRRNELQGTPPHFLGSDWVLETRYVHADFENGTDAEVEGLVVSWQGEQGQSATFSTSDIAAAGTSASLSVTHRGSSGRSLGFALELPTIVRAPGDISYFCRIDQLPAAGAFFALQGSGATAIEGGFTASQLGTRSKDRRVDKLAEADTFFQVEFRNIDWRELRYDLYIDRVLIERDVEFADTVLVPERLSLFTVTADTVSFWDEIEFWHDE